MKRIKDLGLEKFYIHTDGWGEMVYDNNHPNIKKDMKLGNDPRSADADLLDDEKLKAKIERVKPLAQLQAKLYNKEMVKHEFLGSYRCQKAIYSDGTAVIIDLDKNTYEIEENVNAKA